MWKNNNVCHLSICQHICEYSLIKQMLFNSSMTGKRDRHIESYVITRVWYKFGLVSMFLILDADSSWRACCAQNHRIKGWSPLRCSKFKTALLSFQCIQLLLSQYGIWMFITFCNALRFPKWHEEFTAKPYLWWHMHHELTSENQARPLTMQFIPLFWTPKIIHHLRQFFYRYTFLFPLCTNGFMNKRPSLEHSNDGLYWIPKYDCCLLMAFWLDDSAVYTDKEIAKSFAHLQAILSSMLCWTPPFDPHTTRVHVCKQPATPNEF